MGGSGRCDGTGGRGERAVWLVGMGGTGWEVSVVRIRWLDVVVSRGHAGMARMGGRFGVGWVESRVSRYAANGGCRWRERSVGMAGCVRGG